MFIVASTPGIFAISATIGSTTCSVRGLVAPSGSCTAAKTTPWSSSGMNACGETLTIVQQAAMMTASITSATTVRLAIQTAPPTYPRVARVSVVLNHLSGPRSAGFVSRSMWAHMAGDRVRATISEKQTEKPIVTANCLYICPVIPVIKPTGTKIARKTSVVAAIGPVTSFIACIVAVFGSHLSRSMTNCTRSTTTMASSTTVPMTSTSPKRERILMLYPIPSSAAKVARSETGIAATGTSVVRHS